nr:unnamed protein product [Spirometra erinaceieuropaei]
MAQAEPRLDDVDANIHPISGNQNTVCAGARTYTLTWFSPLVEAVALCVIAEQSPATWSPRSNRPEHRTVLVARELARYKVDIGVLSGTRFSEQNQLEEVGAGYTFFWSGRPRAERRDTGVAFAIWNDIVRRPPCLSQDVNDHPMGLRLHLRGS